MSRIQQDQFIDDDEEDTCPLCVEELDLSDRGFRPCPCGYQICQFCYHNVRNNMNGLCPACRRPYDDANIVFNKPSPEEEMAWKARQAAKAKKNTIAAQKEAQKREADTLSRKHLAGLRVVQKNLVYVTGLSPSVQEDHLLETLRGPNYFGQYGKIVKIVVSKAKEPHTQSVGVYVTYARKQDAAMCIQAVDNSPNGDRVLRAQFGTTKYCSAYLRNEQCTNRNCMFLHEPGEDNESFTRQDLSSMNVHSTQQPTSASHSPPPPPPQVIPVAAAHSALRQEAAETPQSPLDSPARPALPSTASWASRAPQMSRQHSSAGRSVSSAALPSPIVAAATPKKEAPKPELVQEPVAVTQPAPVDPTPPPPPPTRQRKQEPASAGLVQMIRDFSASDMTFEFSTSSLGDEEMESIRNFPSLFDPQGGAKRRALRIRDEEDRRRIEQEAQMAMRSATAGDAEDGEEVRGSLQLGGEPEERHDSNASQHVIGHSPAEAFGISNEASSLNIQRGLTPQQHQQLLLQQLKGTPSTQPQPPFTGQLQTGNPTGHARNVSRFTFANDTSTASASVKPVANSKLMNQQSSMMPPPQGALPQQPATGFFSSNVQGPPPGLKTTGTPPFSGGGMFGQGHGFATSGLGYGANLTGRSPNDEMMRDLLRNRNLGGGGGSQVSSDSGKRGGALSAVDVADPSILQARLHQAQAASHNGSQGLAFTGQVSGQEHADLSLSGLGLPAQLTPDLALDARVGTPPVPPGFKGVRTPGLEGLGQATLHSGLDSPVHGLTGLGLGLDSPRRSTPTIPPGFTAEHLSQPPSRSSSRASMRISKPAEKVVPAIPVISGSATPARAGTPLREVVKIKEREEHPTPTKSGRKGKAAKKAVSENDDMRVATEPDTTDGAADEEEIFDQTENVTETAISDIVKGVDKRFTAVVAEDVVTRPKSAAQMLAERHAQSQQAQAAGQPPLTAAQMLEQRHRRSEAERAASRPGSAAASPVGSRAPSPSPSPIKVDKKKQHPGKLDISAATMAPDESPARSQTGTPAPSSASVARPLGAVIKTLPMTTPAVPSRPGTPATGLIDSPAARKVSVAPRTLRVVATPTPKTEIPSGLPLPGDKTEVKSAIPNFPSRKPSLASIVPGTPNSEHAGSSFISDNISVTSTSLSRASSPPPGPMSSRVGSAPVRAKTKNQQKKDRQERARQIEEERLMALEAEKGVTETKDDGVIQEAIIGRKKKQKKAAAPKPKVQNEPQAAVSSGQSQQGTPAQSRPVSPKPAASENVAADPSPAPAPEKIEVPAPEPEPEMQPEEAIEVEEEQQQVESTLPAPKSPSPPPAAPTLSAQDIISELRQDSPLLSSAIDSLLRPLTKESIMYKPGQPVSMEDLNVPRSLERNPDVNIKAVNLEYMWQHNSGLRYGGEDNRVWSRGCVTPGGAHLRHLEDHLEERFIELENEWRKSPEALRYWPETNGRAQEAVHKLLWAVSTSPSASNKTKSLEDEFPRIDLIKLKRVLEEFERYGGRRDANAMEKAVEEGSKKGSFLVDTAGKYVNEFVLPTYGAPSVAGVAISGNAAVGVGAGGGVGATSVVAKLGPGPFVGGVGVEGPITADGPAPQERVGMSVQGAERMLAEAKRMLEEREAQLRKVVKRNRKLVGLSH